jgi:hypothetical protein
MSGERDPAPKSEKEELALAVEKLCELLGYDKPDTSKLTVETLRKRAEGLSKKYEEKLAAGAGKDSKEPEVPEPEPEAPKPIKLEVKSEAKAAFGAITKAKPPEFEHVVAKGFALTAVGGFILDAGDVVEPKHFHDGAAAIEMHRKAGRIEQREKRKA